MQDPKPDQTEVNGKARQSSSDVDVKQVYNTERISRTDVSSSPIPLPAYGPIVSSRSELYYVYVFVLKLSFFQLSFIMYVMCCFLHLKRLGFYS